MNKTLLILTAVTVSRCAPCPAGVVADTLFAEARGEGRRGLEAVASVIFNRSQNKRMPLEAVCLARKQFSCWNEGYTKPNPRNELEEGILAFCEGLESQMFAGTFNPSGSWTHYHTLSVRPNWSAGMKDKRVIGNHLFGVTK